jgi:hypothetical protein
MEETMYEDLKKLTDELAKSNMQLAELVELAYSAGETEETVLEGMLERRLKTIIADYSYPVEAEEPGDDLGWIEDDYESDPEPEPESEPEPEPDALSEKLGVDVDDSAPIQLAAAILRVSGGDANQETLLIRELGARGKSVAQLTSLVEGL